MSNWASTAYAIEGPQETLLKILGEICLAIATDSDLCEEYITCKNLGFPKEEIIEARLRGIITDEPVMDEGVLKVCAEEAWGLQDFNELLEKHFPDLKVYWVVQEEMGEVYATNDREGKYFPERFWVDTCIDGIYESEYFETKEDACRWLSDLTDGTVKSDKDIEDFNTGHEDSGTDDENFINIHEFNVMD